MGRIDLETDGHDVAAERRALDALERDYADKTDTRFGLMGTGLGPDLHARQPIDESDLEDHRCYRLVRASVRPVRASSSIVDAAAAGVNGIFNWVGPSRLDAVFGGPERSREHRESISAKGGDSLTKGARLTV